MIKKNIHSHRIIEIMHGILNDYKLQKISHQDMVSNLYGNAQAIDYIKIIPTPFEYFDNFANEIEFIQWTENSSERRSKIFNLVNKYEKYLENIIRKDKNGM